MRILVLSDIHANLEALQACLDIAPTHDLIVNLGDVVGYNASPNEVCTLVRAMGGLVVRGNHDRACSGLTDLSDFNPVAAMSAYWTKGELAAEHLEWLRALPEGPVRRDGFPGVEFVHGSPRDEDEYLLNTYGAESSFRSPGHLNRIFFGHTHVQGGFFLERGRTRPFTIPYDNSEGLAEFTMVLNPADRYLINPGSVGQPRDGDWRAAFAVYDDTPGSVTFFRVPYAVEQTQSRIRTALLPDRLATRLSQGR